MSANRSVHIAASYGVSMTEFREDIDKPSVVDGGGEPPQNGEMEARVKALETFAQDARERLVRIETKLDHAATKDDISQSANRIIMWMVGVLFALSAGATSIMTFVLNHATTKPPAAQPAPTVIVVPATPAPSIAASH